VNFREAFEVERQTRLKRFAHKMMSLMHMQMDECHDFMCEIFSNFTQKLGCYNIALLLIPK
jgi:hypothetical protein